MTVTLPTLDQTRDLVQPALREAIDRLDPETRRVAAYHFGWVDPTGRTAAGGGGKAVRPALALLGAAAVGGSANDAVPGAVAVELVHNFSLVHDDLMDRDAERRHRPTVWTVWGDPVAVLVGDAMLSLSHEVLAASGSPYAAAASRVITAATRELIRGQMADLAFEARAQVTAAECLDMAIGKTAALLGASSGIGALLVGADGGTVAALTAFGHEIGIAFQLVDDLLGLWGEPETTGKPVFSDLRRRKKTLPVTWAIEHGGSYSAELAAWFATGSQAEPATGELARIADLIERVGARDWLQTEADRRLRRALAAIEPVPMPEQCRSSYRQLAEFIVERQA